MDKYVTLLTTVIPPPGQPKGNKPQWNLAENELDVRYPESFKDLIEVYGNGIWFDDAKLIYPGKTGIENTRGIINQWTDRMATGMRDCKTGKEATFALYPDKGALLPFMIDFSSGVYCWDTSVNKPENWAVVYWSGYTVSTLPAMSVAEMFYKWIKEEEPMVSFWGKASDLPDTRISFLSE